MLQARNTHRIVAILAVAVCLVATSAIHAQDDANPNQGKVSFSAGMDITNAYYFRGLRQEEQGIIAQPWMEVTFNLSDTVDLTAGIWEQYARRPDRCFCQWRWARLVVRSRSIHWNLNRGFRKLLAGLYLHGLY